MEEFLGHGECFIDFACWYAVVDNVDEAYGLAGIDKLISNRLSLVVVAMCPMSKVYDWDAGLFGSCVTVCLVHDF